MRQTSRYFSSRLIFVLAAFLLLSASLQSSSDIKVSINDKTSLKLWQLKEGVLEIDLAAQPPKSIKAFFIARGFTTEIAGSISQHCVFQVIVRNKGVVGRDSAVHISLQEWQVRHEGSIDSLKLKEVWDKEWSKEHVSDAARIAFRWATFPSKQTFAPTGDYGWGMISIGLKPAEMFDLQVVWKQGATVKKEWLRGMSCPQES